MALGSGCARPPQLFRLLNPSKIPVIEAETRLWYQTSSAAFLTPLWGAAPHLYERYLTTYPKSRRERSPGNWRSRMNRWGGGGRAEEYPDIGRAGGRSDFDAECLC